MRELGNIRNFLTSSALTRVVDRLFIFAFLIVVAWYSVFLTLIVMPSLPCFVAMSACVTPVFPPTLDEAGHFCAGLTMTHCAFGTPRVAGRSRLPVAASAERHVTPVIGNHEYRCAAVLPNPRRDAKAVAEDLRQVGLQTVSQVDRAPDAI